VQCYPPSIWSWRHGIVYLTSVEKDDNGDETKVENYVLEMVRSTPNESEAKRKGRLLRFQSPRIIENAKASIFALCTIQNRCLSENI